MHKTGTTSVQHNLRKIDHTGEWRYLCVGAKLHMNMPFFAMFATNPLSYKWFGKLGISKEAAAERGENLRNRLAEEIRSAPEEVIVMSAEALTLIDGPGIQRLKEFLTPFFDEIRVIGYVRPPVSFKISIYQELIKQGRNRFDAIDIKVSYRAKFEKFDQSFGRENVTLVKFEPESFPDKCIVSDFCQRTGIRFPGDMPVERANDGMCREACGILFAYFKHGPGYGSGKGVIAENAWILNALQAMRGTKLAIRKSLFHDALSRERDDITWMEERLGASLAEKLEDKESEIAAERDLLCIDRPSFMNFVDQFEICNKVRVPRDVIPSTAMMDPVLVADFVELCRDLARVNQQRQIKKRPKSSGRKNADGSARGSGSGTFKRRCARMVRAIQHGFRDAGSVLRSSFAGLGSDEKHRKSASPSRGAGDITKDIERHEKAVRHNRKDPELYLQLGVCYLRSGDWSQAKEAVATAIFLKPDHKRGFRYYRYATRKLLEKRTEKARKVRQAQDQVDEKR